MNRDLVILFRVVASCLTAGLLIFFFSAFSGEDLLRNHSTIKDLDRNLEEISKNSRGYQIIGDTTSRFFRLPDSAITIDGKESVYQRGLFLGTPVASPALMSVGYIIGPRLAAVAWAGGAFAWLCLVPLAVFLNGRFDWSGDMGAVFDDVWRRQIRLIAIGAMVVGAVHTLWKLRGPLVDGLSRAFLEQFRHRHLASASRLQKDIPLGFILAGVAALTVPVTVIYYSFTGDIVASLVIAVAMIARASPAGYPGPSMADPRTIGTWVGGAMPGRRAGPSRVYWSSRKRCGR